MRMLGYSFFTWTMSNLAELPLAPSLTKEGEGRKLAWWATLAYTPHHFSKSKGRRKPCPCHPADRNGGSMGRDSSYGSINEW